MRGSPDLLQLRTNVLWVLQCPCAEELLPGPSSCKYLPW